MTARPSAINSTSPLRTIAVVLPVPRSSFFRRLGRITGGETGDAEAAAAGAAGAGAAEAAAAGAAGAAGAAAAAAEGEEAAVETATKSSSVANRVCHHSSIVFPVRIENASARASAIASAALNSLAPRPTNCARKYFTIRSRLGSTTVAEASVNVIVPSSTAAATSTPYRRCALSASAAIKNLEMSSALNFPIVS